MIAKYGRKSLRLVGVWMSVGDSCGVSRLRPIFSNVFGDVFRRPSRLKKWRNVYSAKSTVNIVEKLCNCTRLSTLKTTNY
uniref:Uncharacterized protein n=1 Tax=Romanomermis culicivorax TaxID=13658 RepID=A0A915I3P7_ROMCU